MPTRTETALALLDAIENDKSHPMLHDRDEAMRRSGRCAAVLEVARELHIVDDVDDTPEALVRVVRRTREEMEGRSTKHLSEIYDVLSDALGADNDNHQNGVDAVRSLVLQRDAALRRLEEARTSQEKIETNAWIAAATELRERARNSADPEWARAYEVAARSLTNTGPKGRIPGLINLYEDEVALLVLEEVQRVLEGGKERGDISEGSIIFNWLNSKVDNLRAVVEKGAGGDEGLRPVAGRLVQTFTSQQLEDVVRHVVASYVEDEQQELADALRAQEPDDMMALRGEIADALRAQEPDDMMALRGEIAEAMRPHVPYGENAQWQGLAVDQFLGLANVSREEALELQKKWRERWPEMAEFFQFQDERVTVEGEGDVLKCPVCGKLGDDSSIAVNDACSDCCLERELEQEQEHRIRVDAIQKTATRIMEVMSEFHNDATILDFRDRIVGWIDAEFLDIPEHGEEKLLERVVPVSSSVFERVAELVQEWYPTKTPTFAPETLAARLRLEAAKVKDFEAPSVQTKAKAFMMAGELLRAMPFESSELGSAILMRAVRILRDSVSYPMDQFMERYDARIEMETYKKVAKRVRKCRELGYIPIDLVREFDERAEELDRQLIESASKVVWKPIEEVHGVAMDMRRRAQKSDIVGEDLMKKTMVVAEQAGRDIVNYKPWLGWLQEMVEDFDPGDNVPALAPSDIERWFAWVNDLRAGKVDFFHTYGEDSDCKSCGVYGPHTPQTATCPWKIGILIGMQQALEMVRMRGKSGRRRKPVEEIEDEMRSESIDRDIDQSRRAEGKPDLQDAADHLVRQPGETTEEHNSRLVRDVKTAEKRIADAKAARDKGPYVALGADLRVVARATSRETARTAAIARGEPAPTVVHENEVKKVTKPEATKAPLLIVLDRPLKEVAACFRGHEFRAITDNVFMLITEQSPIEVRDVLIDTFVDLKLDPLCDGDGDVVFVTTAPAPSAWEGLSDSMMWWLQSWQRPLQDSITRIDALNMIEAYCQILKEDGDTDTTFTELRERFPEDGSHAKAMRWLGFIQGALMLAGRFTLEELKQHSTYRCVPASPPKPEGYRGLRPSYLSDVSLQKLAEKAVELEQELDSDVMVGPSKCPGSGTEVNPGFAIFIECPDCAVEVRAEFYAHPDGEVHFKLVDHNRNVTAGSAAVQKQWADWMKETVRENTLDLAHEPDDGGYCANCGGSDLNTACPFKMGVLVGMQVKEDDVARLRRRDEFLTASVEGVVEYWKTTADNATRTIERIKEWSETRRGPEAADVYDILTGKDSMSREETEEKPPSGYKTEVWIVAKSPKDFLILGRSNELDFVRSVYKSMKPVIDEEKWGYGTETAMRSGNQQSLDVIERARKEMEQ